MHCERSRWNKIGDTDTCHVSQIVLWNSGAEECTQYPLQVCVFACVCTCVSIMGAWFLDTRVSRMTVGMLGASLPMGRSWKAGRQFNRKAGRTEGKDHSRMKRFLISMTRKAGQRLRFEVQLLLHSEPHCIQVESATTGPPWCHTFQVTTPMYFSPGLDLQ